MGTREVLHLEGKRARDVQRDSEQRKGLKRKNRESKASEETNKRKEASNKKREEILKEFASVEKIAKLCSGQEKCCNGRCLEVREFDYRCCHLITNIERSATTNIIVTLR